MSIEVKQMIIKSNISEQAPENETYRGSDDDLELRQEQMLKEHRRALHRLMPQHRER